MPTSTQDNYLVTEVMTATPQKLRLILIQAAIRFSQQALQNLQAGDASLASKALSRAQETVSEIIAGVNFDDRGDLANRVAGIYLFVYRSLVEAQLNLDETKIAEALRVLEIERSTWQEICGETALAPSPEGAMPTGANFEA